MKKPKVLCICKLGLNRSKYLASYLKNKGYRTKYGGIKYDDNQRKNPLKPEYIEWADVIILVRKSIKKILMEKYKPKNKKIIVLDVTDSKRLIPEEFAHLRELDYETFQRKWTRPQLRKALKPYLPLKAK